MNSDIKDIITNLEEYSNKDFKLLMEIIKEHLGKRFLDKFKGEKKK